MREIRMALTSLKGRGLIRILIVLLYVVVFVRYFDSGYANGGFIGMFQLPDDFTASLEYNIYALMFMIFGVALTLEQPSEYLLVPDTFVYIRQRRGIAQFARYAALLIVYCLIFAGLQVGATALMTEHMHLGQWCVAAACSAWMLFNLLLICNIGYLAGNRALGYLAALLIYGALLSFKPAMQWMLGVGTTHIANWVLVSALCSIALAAVNLALFERTEIQ